MDVDYKILYSYFSDGGGDLLLPNIKVNPIPYHNFLLLLKGHNFPILCSYLLPVSGVKNCWETHVSELEKRYRNKGYGKLMYKHMINFGLSNNMKIVSSPNTSKSAKCVWESLKKDYNIEFVNRSYIVKGILE